MSSSARTQAPPTDVDRLRGLITGLVLGDALGISGAGAASADVLRIGVAGQLACFTVDSLIRAHCREVDRGIPTDRVVLSWFNQRRWARLQGLSVAAAEMEMHSDSRTDDWLARVPALVERRGSAPATTAAVATSPSPDGDARRESLGAHGLVPVLPWAVAGVALQGAHWFADVKKAAQLTHAPAVGDLALLGSRWLACTWAAGSPMRGAQLAMATGADSEGVVADIVLRTHDQPAAADQTPDRSARSALVGGIAAALSCAGPEHVEEALLTAAAAPATAPGAAAVAGAALGASYGLQGLPSALVARLEIADDVDRLARDLAVAVDLASPSRDFYVSYPTV